MDYNVSYGCQWLDISELCVCFVAPVYHGAIYLPSLFISSSPSVPTVTD